MSHLRSYRSIGIISRPAGAAVAALKARAAAWDIPLVETPEQLSMTVSGCELRLTPLPDSVTVHLTAPERRLIGNLRDSATELFAEIGLDISWDHVDTGELAPGLSLMQVERVSTLGPNFLRVRLAGADAARFADGGLHFRLLLPPAGRAAVWPRVTASGRVGWPDGEDRLHKPVYTVSALGDGWLDFDIFRHDGSPTCDWALADPVGQTIAIMGPGGGSCPDADRIWLFGDETALPAIRRILSRSHRQVSAAISCAPEDLGSLRSDPRICRTDDLVDQLVATQFDADDFIWFAANAEQAGKARQHLLQAGQSKRNFLVAAYWS
ncbi:siderophore-interacting protein [Paracoccus seriniphilus]|uniref:siderophore-interacting protein n=1 Tax=Paracoccus seriniphilus TaxID=184748 RepID=UPI0035648E25